MERLTVTVNSTTYELSDEFRANIERIAENEYGENEFLDYYWRSAGSNEETHAYGDPILSIETEGPFIPWEDLSEFEIEEDSPVSRKSGSSGSPDKTPLDNGNGVASVPRDNVAPDNEEPDYKMVIFPERFRPYPDPDDGKLSTFPPKPERYDEDNGPTMIIPIPENKRPERWAAGESIVPVFTTVEWNLQRRADTVPAYGTYRDGDSHDKWEDWLRASGSTVVSEEQGDDTPSGEERKQMYDEGGDIGPKYGSSAQNFRI